jgi:hypothetical protein
MSRLTNPAKLQLRKAWPTCVRSAVQRLQALCPTLGKKKITEVLTRAGLHLRATTIGRMRKEKPIAPPSPRFRLEIRQRFLRDFRRLFTE